MGGCATKPKVLKGEEGEAPAPAPAPESVKESSVNAVPVETEKEVAAGEEDGGEKKKVEEEKGDDQAAGTEEKVITEGEKADEQEGKPRSLSNLFKVIIY